MHTNDMLTTAEAADYLTRRGIIVRGRPPTMVTVEVWCRKGVIPAYHMPGQRQGFYLIDPAALESFTPPLTGAAAHRTVTTRAQSEA